MRKYFVLLLCIFLVSCNSIDVNENDYEAISIDSLDYVGTFDNGDEIYIDEYRYYLQDAAWSMILVRNNEIVKLFTGSPSRPKFSDDRKKILYVDTLQFETYGNVTIYDSETEDEETYTSYSYDNGEMTVKAVDWYSDDSILCIIGYASGTVTQGGMLYQLNLSTGELKSVLSNEIIDEWTSRPYEVADFYIDENGLEITLVEWTDDNLNEPYYTKHYISYEELKIEKLKE